LVSLCICMTKGLWCTHCFFANGGMWLTDVKRQSPWSVGKGQRSVKRSEDHFFIILYSVGFPLAIWADTQGSLWPVMGEHVLDAFAWAYYLYFFAVFYRDAPVERTRMIAVSATFACVELFFTEKCKAYQYLRLVPNDLSPNTNTSSSTGMNNSVFTIVHDNATQNWVNHYGLVYVHRLVPLSVPAGHWCMFDWCRRTTRALQQIRMQGSTIQPHFLFAALFIPLIVATLVLGCENVDLFSVKALLPFACIFAAAMRVRVRVRETWQSSRGHDHRQARLLDMPTSVLDNGSTNVEEQLEDGEVLFSLPFLAVTWWLTLLIEIYGTWMYCWRWDPHFGAVLGWITFDDFHTPNPPVLIGVLYTMVHLVPDGVVACLNYSQFSS